MEEEEEEEGAGEEEKINIEEKDKSDRPDMRPLLQPTSQHRSWI